MFLISLFVLFKKSFLGPRGDCGGMRPTGHKHSPGCGCPGATYKDRDHGTTPQNTLAGLQHCWTYCCLVRALTGASSRWLLSLADCTETLKLDPEDAMSTNNGGSTVRVTMHPSSTTQVLNICFVSTHGFYTHACFSYNFKT